MLGGFLDQVVVVYLEVDVDVDVQVQFQVLLFGHVLLERFFAGFVQVTDGLLVLRRIAAVAVVV